MGEGAQGPCVLPRPHPSSTVCVTPGLGCPGSGGASKEEWYCRCLRNIRKDESLEIDEVGDGPKKLERGKCQRQGRGSGQVAECRDTRVEDEVMRNVPWI